MVDPSGGKERERKEGQGNKYHGPFAFSAANSPGETSTPLNESSTKDGPDGEPRPFLSTCVSSEVFCTNLKRTRSRIETHV